MILVTRTAERGRDGGAAGLIEGLVDSPPRVIDSIIASNNSFLVRSEERVECRKKSPSIVTGIYWIK